MTYDITGRLIGDFKQLISDMAHGHVKALLLLTATAGNVARAAGKLELSPQLLNFKMRKLGIQRPAK